MVPGVRLPGVGASGRERLQDERHEGGAMSVERRMRAALEELAELSRDGEIGGGEFQDVLIERGLMVEVPASEAFRAENGGDTMLELRLDS